MLCMFNDVFSFNLDRLTQPLVIVGLVILVIGFCIMLFGGKIATAIDKKLIKSGKSSNSDWNLIVKAVSFLVAVAGALMAILSI